jgi:hypothetical protein
MARTQFADEKRPPVWRVAENVMNKQLRTADNGGPPVWVLGELLIISHQKDYIITKRSHLLRSWTDCFGQTNQ